MSPPKPLYHRRRFPPEVISHCDWLYFRFCLSYRGVEELMARRGVVPPLAAARRLISRMISSRASIRLVVIFRFGLSTCAAPRPGSRCGHYANPLPPVNQAFPGCAHQPHQARVSTSFGVRGAHVMVSDKGTRTTVGIPGTGLSNTEYEPHEHPAQDAQPRSSAILFWIVMCAVLATIYFVLR